MKLLRLKYLKAEFVAFAVAILAILISSCSSGGNDLALSTEVDPNAKRIEGTVVEQITGEPVFNAVVYTDPPTDVVRTNINGEYSINDGFNEPGQYRVFLEHNAYNNQEKTASVSENDASVVDFVLTSAAIGLQVNRTQIQFPNDQNRTTFRLSSNIQNSGYSILTSDPWLLISPNTGVITNRETAIIEINLNREMLPAGERAQSEIVVNATDGTRSVVISVLISNTQSTASAANPNTNTDTSTETNTNTNTDTAVSSDQVTIAETNVEPNSRQLDCRRPDIFRTGLNNPLEPLIQFLPSLELPRDTGLIRSLRIINPFLVDSFVVTEIGTVELAHIDGDSDATTLTIYEWDTNGNLVTLATGAGPDSENRRATISYGILPGVYCYALYPADEPFSNPENITIRFRFKGPQ